jgi:hypothetical protein
VYSGERNYKGGSRRSRGHRRGCLWLNLRAQTARALPSVIGHLHCVAVTIASNYCEAAVYGLLQVKAVHLHDLRAELALADVGGGGLQGQLKVEEEALGVGRALDGGEEEE